MQSQVSTYPLAMSCKSALQASRMGEVKNNRVIIGVRQNGTRVLYIARCLNCRHETGLIYDRFSQSHCLQCKDQADKPSPQQKVLSRGARYAPDYTAGLNARERSRFQMYRSVGFSEREALSSVLARRGA